MTLGPELETTGYGCEDHFLELVQNIRIVHAPCNCFSDIKDTFEHSDEILAEILMSDLTHGILVDIGCPVSYGLFSPSFVDYTLRKIIHGNVRYNCRVFCLNGQIVLIRPKVDLADDGNYREPRYFTGWKGALGEVEEHHLSHVLQRATGQRYTKFGVTLIRCADTVIASEICEELWTPKR